MNIVFEIIEEQHRHIINRSLKNKNSVWIVEPFYTFHHKKGSRFSPPPLPDFVSKLIKNGEINLLKVSQLKAKGIYQFSADKAVEVIESVYPQYRKEHEELFEYVSDTLKSPVAENVFKKILCERLAEFYSVNILLHRVEEVLGPGPILVYPDTNVPAYLHLKELLSRSSQEFFEHPNIRFPLQTYVAAFFENLKECLIAMVRLSAQTIASGLLGRFRPSQEKKKKGYSYGMTIIARTRQLSDNQRGPDFIIDNNKILPEDVVYFPLTNLNDNQKKRLAEVPGEVFYPPKAGQCFSHFAEWSKLLWLVSKKNILRNGEEINGACKVFFNYFSWLKIMETVNIRHFITHCDFGGGHIGRNLALNQAGVQTWYFLASAHFGCSLKGLKKNVGMRHPFWVYLYYDHFVAWDELLARYNKGHPGAFKQTHVVGCLWSSHIQEKMRARNSTTNPFLKDLQDRFVLAVFDSTYIRNAFSSYAEGLVFAEHILKLADAFPGIYIFLKEKKDRTIHPLLDPDLSPKLLELYEKMERHPRITICYDRADASELISISDMVVSFPFTSTTFEALSANKPALWHDPMGYYRSTPYGKIGGVTTHSYDELKAKVLEIKNMEPGMYQNPIPMGSPLMDPYRDGKAIDRFRDLLVSS